MNAVVLDRPGYEAVRYFRDCGTIGYWYAAVRKIGVTFWTDCGSIGHSHIDNAELDKRAIEAAARYIDWGLV